MKTRKPQMLTKRYNKDGSISLLCRGRVVQKFKLGAYTHLSVLSFCQGWYGDHPMIFGRTQHWNVKRKNYNV